MSSEENNSNIRALPTFERKAVQATIQLAEELLEMAKSGEVQTFAAAVIYKDELPGTLVPPHKSATQLLGAVQVLSTRMTLNYIVDDIDLRERLNLVKEE